MRPRYLFLRLLLPSIAFSYKIGLWSPIVSDLANKGGGNLILIGFMGTGKSTVGKRVAQSLGFEFVDTDEEIVKKVGKSIAQIFDESGEVAFREIETSTLTKCCEKSRQVISTGGGAVTQKQNHSILKAGGYVIWLKASAETVYNRVRRNHDRPLLKTANPEKTIREMLSSREDSYAACADLEIETDDLTLEQTIYGVTETAQYCQVDGRLPGAENSEGSE